MRCSTASRKGEGNCSTGWQRKSGGTGKESEVCLKMREKADYIIDAMDYVGYADFCRMLCILRWNVYLCG